MADDTILSEAPAPAAEAIPPATAEPPAPASEAASVAEAAPAEVTAAAAESAPEGAAPAEAAPAEPVAAEPAPDAKPEGEAKVEAAPEPPAPLTYEAFTFPEGITAPPERIEAFTAIVGPHQLPQDAAQALIDLHSAELKAVADQTTQHQFDVFEETKKTWRDDFYKTYGNRADTVANDAKWAIQQLVPNAEKRKEVFDALKASGLGDHKAMIGLMAAAAGKMRERPAPAPPLAPKVSQDPATRRYGPQPTR